MDNNFNGHNKPQSTLIFLHIPKTAGQTLHTIIEKQYDTNHIFSIGINTQERIDEFKKFSEEERKNIRVLKGHMSFGMHEFMPQPCTYITLLRDPVERIISSYYYVLREPRHYLHNRVISKQMSLKDFVSSGISTDLDNGQTRRLSGVSAGRLLGSRIISFGNCDPSLLKVAKENLLKYFSVVGISEKFDESLLRIKQTLDWNNCFYVKKNVTRNRILSQDIPKNTLNEIRKHNQLDLELYQYWNIFFTENITNQGALFATELENFRRFNSFYCRTAHLGSLSKSGIRWLKSSVKKVLIKQ